MSREGRPHRPTDEGSSSHSTNSSINNFGGVVHQAWFLNIENESVSGWIRWNNRSAFITPQRPASSSSLPWNFTTKQCYLLFWTLLLTIPFPRWRYSLCTHSGPVARNTVVLCPKGVLELRKAIRCLLTRTRRPMLSFHVSASPVSFINSCKSLLSLSASFHFQHHFCGPHNHPVSSGWWQEPPNRSHCFLLGQSSIYSWPCSQSDIFARQIRQDYSACWKPPTYPGTLLCFLEIEQDL